MASGGEKPPERVAPQPFCLSREPRREADYSSSSLMLQLSLFQPPSTLFDNCSLPDCEPSIFRLAAIRLSIAKFTTVIAGLLYVFFIIFI